MSGNPADMRTLIPRKRGGQPGNRNRLKHGRYTQRRAARREKTRALIGRARNLIIRIEMMAKARKALRNLRKAQTESLPLPRKAGERAG